MPTSWTLSTIEAAVFVVLVVILVGAELDAEMEHQTARDTTTGSPKPMGSRGAQVADTVGKACS